MQEKSSSSQKLLEGNDEGKGVTSYGSKKRGDTTPVKKENFLHKRQPIKTLETESNADDSMEQKEILDSDQEIQYQYDEGEGEGEEIYDDQNKFSFQNEKSEMKGDNDEFINFDKEGNIIFPKDLKSINQGKNLKETNQGLSESKDQTRIRDENRNLGWAQKCSRLLQNYFGLVGKEKTGKKSKKLEEQHKRVKNAIKKRKIMRYSAYFTYLVMIAVGLILFFKYSIIRNTVYFYNLSASNTTLKLAVDNCSLHIMDPDESNMPASIYLQYFMPPGHESGSASVGSQIITEDSLIVNILNAGDPYYCMAKLFIKADITPLSSFEITCGKCNITQDTSAQLEINGLLNISGDSVHANFKNVKVGALAYESFTGHIQFNNIESGPEVNNIVMSGEGDIIIQSIQDFVVNATTNTQAFCLGGTSLTSLDNGTCIYSDQDQSIPSKYKTCSLSWSVCINQDCNLNSFPTYVVNSTNGNVYANAISKVGSPVIPNQVVSGQIYNQGISFSSTAETVLESFDQYVADPDKSNPFVVLNVGDIASRSSKYAKWIVSSVPSYALMKPWWIGTFSASLLNGYVKGANGILLPGFCPFYPDFINQDLLSMQNLIYTKIKTPQTLVTFVVDESMPAPTNHHQNSTGVFPLIQKGNPSDRWFSLALSAGGNIILENNDYTKRGEILAAIIVSLVIAFYVVYLTITLTFISINMIYTKLVDFSSHLLNYSKLEQSRIKQTSEDLQTKENQTETADSSTFASIYNYNFIHFLKHAPSPLAFIDYLALIFLRQFSNSVVQFYYLLFREYTENDDDQELDPNQNMMKGTDVKALYEKFCFMNHFHEQKLTDSMNQAVLRSYGFEIKIREDLEAQVFTRLIIKNKTPFHVSLRQLKNRTSLDYYIQENVKLTQFDEDQIEVNEFNRHYEEFCEFNKFTSIPISPSLMKDKYNINMTFVPQQYILRIQEQSNTILDTGYNFFMRLTKQQKKYIIDKSKLENHFKLIMNDTSQMTVDEISEATSDLILYPRWPLWDIFTVFLHLLLGALIILPLVYFVILNESQYQPWSLKDNQYLIRYNDCVHDPYQCTKNLYNSFTWNVVLMIIATILLIFSSLDLMLYYAIMEFPQDKSFKKSQKKVEEKFLERFSRQVEWIFVLLAFVLYFGYGGLVLIWLLLGAFINPTTFLPFASAAVTFVVFVVSKFNSFKEVSKQGTKMIQRYVSKLFRTFTSKVLTKISKNFENAQMLQQKELAKFTEAKTLNEMGIQFENKSDATASDPTSIKEGEENEHEEILSQAFNRKKSISPQDLRVKKIMEIKSECDKRKFPKELTHFILAIFARDESMQRVCFKSVLGHLNKKSLLSKEAAEIMTEIVFPQGIKKEETVQYIKLMVLTHVQNEAKMKNIKGLTAEALHEMFLMFRLLDELDYDSFLKSFRQQFIKANKLSFNDIFQPILDIAAVISKEKPDHWNIEPFCFKLFKIANYLHSKDSKAKNMLPENEAEIEAAATIDKFIKFLPLIFSSFEVPYNVDDPKNLFDPRESLKTIENFCEAVHILDKNNPPNENKKQYMGVSAFIYLGISTLRFESGDMPRRVIRAIEEAFQIDFSSNKFLPFCLNLTNVLYNKPQAFYHRLSRSATIFGVHPDLQNILKLITCCHMPGFEDHYPANLIEKNPYFMKIARTIKVEPKELLGLIYLISGKRNNRYVDEFFRAILKRMNLNPDLLETLVAVTSIFFFEDEVSLFKAIKTLDLAHGHFLLVGKHVLNPKYLPKSDFQKFNILSGLPKKDTIYHETDKHFVNWKLNIRSELDKILKAIENEGQENGETTENLELIKLYLNDWRNFHFSKKNILAAIKALNSERNNLQAKLLNLEPGKDFTGVDYLMRMILLSKLTLENGKKLARLDKETENALVTLAGYLGCDTDVLTHFMKIFFTSDKDIVMNSFLTFFPEERKNETKINKILGFCFAQVFGMQNLLEFVNKEFANSIEFFDKPNVKVPPNLIKKIYFGASYGDLDINDILELASLKIDSLYEGDHVLRQRCLDLSFFAKGIVVDSFKSQISPKVVDLIQIFSESNHDNRYSQITEMFPRYKNESEHPIKIALALCGMLTQSKFTVRSRKQIDQKQIKGQTAENTDAKRKVIVQPIKVFLGDAFKIHPEFFDLFEIIFERDASKFFQKSLPLFRRLSGSSIIDSSLLESVFSLSVGEKFNAYYLSQKLGISPDIIDFFISMIRISKTSTRKKELEAMEDSIAAVHILERLKINPIEFFYLLRLIFNQFEINEEEILEILKNIGIKGEDDEADLIQIDFLKGLFAITSFTDPKRNIMKNKKALAKLQPQLTKFWSTVELSHLSQDALLIASLAAGNFLILEEFKNHLKWAFPFSDDPTAGRIILNLTMGLYGIVNSNVKVYSDLNADVEAFVESYPVNSYSSDETDYSPQKNSSILPNNSLAYSIYLTYATLNISPKWIQAYLLDKKTIRAINDQIPNINKEFMLGVILQFKNMSEIVGDLFSFYDWTMYCIKTSETSEKEILDKIEQIEKLFEEKIDFKFQTVKDMAASSGLLADPFWQGVFNDSADYNYKINQSLFYLLTNENKGVNKDEHRKFKEEKAKQLLNDFSLAPIDFLGKLTPILVSEAPEKELRVGKQIIKAIRAAYEIVSQKMSNNKESCSDFALIDLCMIADLTSLRSNSNSTFQKKLYRLRGLFINIERKMIFNEVFHKMSKFKIMKLLAIALNMQLSDVLEDRFKPSLFNNDLVTKYAESKHEERDNIKKEICKLFLSNPKDSDLSKLSGGSLGYSDYTKYGAKIGNILDFEALERMNTLEGFDAYLLQNDYQEVFQRSKSEIEEKNEAKLFETTLMNPNMIMIQQLLRGDPTDILEGDHVFNQQDKTRENTKLYVAIVGLQSYSKKEHKNKLAFSSYLRTLSNFMKSDILALDEILEFLVTRKGNFFHTTNILDISDNILNLLLISIRNEKKHDDDEDERYAKEYPSNNVSFKISENLKTVIPDKYLEPFIKLRKIYLLNDPDALNFFIQGLRRDIIKEEENYIQKQINKINKKLWKNKDEKNTEDTKPHPLEKLAQMIDFEKLKKQVKSGEDKKIIKSLKTISKDEDGAMIKILKEIVLPYYEQLKEEKEKEKVKNTKNKKIEKNQDKAKNQIEKEVLIKNCEIINSLLRQDFASAFRRMILKFDREEKNYCFRAERILKEFDIELGANDAIYFVFYVTFAQTNINAFREDSIYNDTIESIVDEMVKTKIFPYVENKEKEGARELLSAENKKLDKKSAKSLSKLMLGAFAWDFNLCIKALASEKTLDEAFLLYNLYACLNMEKILTINEKSTGKDRSEKSYTSQSSEESPSLHLKALLPLVYPKIFYKPPNEINLEKKFKSHMEDCLGKNSEDKMAEALEKKSETLFTQMYYFDDNPENASENIFGINKISLKPKRLVSKKLSKRIGRTLEDTKNEPFSLGTSDEASKYTVFEEILCSFCDAKIFKKLIDTFFEEKIGNLLRKLFHFLIEFKSFNWKGKNIQQTQETFRELINSILKLNEPDIWTNVNILSAILLDIIIIVLKQNGKISEDQREEIKTKLSNLLNLNPGGHEEGQEEKNEKELLLDIVDVMVTTSRFRYDLQFDTMTKGSFDKLCGKLFPGIFENKEFKAKHMSFYSLFGVLNVDYLEKIDDKKGRFKVIRSLLNTFVDLKLCSSRTHMEILLNLLNNNFNGSEKLIEDLSSSYTNESSLLIRDYFQEAQKYFKSQNFEEIESSLFPPTTHPTTRKKKMDNEDWTQVMKKIKEGTTTSRDLFKMIDQEGDHNGSINEAEFLVLSGRLGLKLSDHRVKEIFAKVKGAKVQDADYNELNEEEFEKALTYLEEKNLQQALELLGITPEILTAILIRLTILLLLIFVFLYLGLKAFTIGGTFGSIVNSIFPIAGGVALSKDKQGEENLDEEKVIDATDKGFNIATSAEL